MWIEEAGKLGVEKYQVTDGHFDTQDGLPQGERYETRFTWPTKADNPLVHPNLQHHHGFLNGTIIGHRTLWDLGNENGNDGLQGQTNGPERPWPAYLITANQCTSSRRKSTEHTGMALAKTCSAENFRPRIFVWVFVLQAMLIRTWYSAGETIYT